MKLLVIRIFTVLLMSGLVSCGGLGLNSGKKNLKSRNTYKPRSERIKKCVFEMLNRDVQAMQAMRVCNKIYRGELGNE